MLTMKHTIAAHIAVLIGVLAGGRSARAGAGIELSLADCMHRAARDNPTVLAARAALTGTEGLILEARADALPQLGFGANYTWLDRGLLEGFGTEEEGTVIIGDDETYEYGFTASQLLYRGGQVRSAVRIADLGRQAADREYRAVLADILLEVRIAFYDVLRDRSQVDVQEQTVDLLERSLEWTRDRFDAGAVPRLEVLRAEVELANAIPGLIRARNRLRLSRERLSTLLSLERPDDDQESDSLPIVTGAFLPILDPPPLSDMLASAEAVRPELQELVFEEQIREESINAARAGNRPSFSVQGDYGWSSSMFVPGEEISGWRAMVLAEVPIFDGFRTRGRVIQAEAALDQTRYRRSESRLGVELEVRAAHGDVLESIEFVSSQKKNAERAQEALRLAAASYEVGTVTQLDLLDARVALTVALSLQVEAEYAYSTSVTRLEHAAGQAETWLMPATEPPASPETSKDTSGEQIPGG
jgi:outer membrane protein TolC